MLQRNTTHFSVDLFMSGMFINLTPSFRNQQICVFSEYSVEKPAISISRDQENRILSQFRQIISTTMVCENIFLDDKGDIIQTVMGPTNPSSTPFFLPRMHKRIRKVTFFFEWHVNPQQVHHPYFRLITMAVLLGQFV